MNDPLAPFRQWEGQELGPDHDLEPGFYSPERPPRNMLHYAGMHVTSTARVDRHGELHPAVWIKAAVKVVGTEIYHVVEGMMDAPMAIEFAEALRFAADRAPLDIVAARKQL